MFAPSWTPRDASHTLYAVPEENERSMDMHGDIAEDKASYTVGAFYETETGSNRFDAIPRTYQRALKHSGLSGAERAILDDLAENTFLAYPRRMDTCRSAAVIAEACGLNITYTRQTLTLLRARNIIVRVNAGASITAVAVWRINTDPDTWQPADTAEIEATRQHGRQKATSDDAFASRQKATSTHRQKATTLVGKKQPILKSLDQSQDQSFNNNDARETLPIDISHDTEQEPTNASSLDGSLSYPKDKQLFRAAPPEEIAPVGPPALWPLWNDMRRRYANAGPEAETGPTWQAMRTDETEFGLEFCVYAMRYYHDLKVAPDEPHSYCLARAYMRQVMTNARADGRLPGELPKEKVVARPSNTAPPKRLLKQDPNKRTTNPDGSPYLPPQWWRDQQAAKQQETPL